MDPQTDSVTSKSEMEAMRDRCEALLKENEDLSHSFEQKRARFKEVYQAKEKIVSEQSSTLESLRKKLAEKEDIISKLQLEIVDIKMVASVSENTKQEAVERLNKRHQDENESLRKAMEESHEESQREMVRHFERERRQWEKKLGALNADKRNLEMELKDARKREHRSGDLSEEEELEESMKKAHAESEKLKSVVLPLEKEIEKLKHELEQTRQELESTKQDAADLSAKSSKVIDAPSEVETADDAQTEPVIMKELDHSLKCEKSSRTDLEMYVEVLRQQKKACEQDKEKMEELLQNVRRQFEMEKAEHVVLKQTWLAANDQFLESQRLLMRDNSIIEGVLSEDQRRQVKMLKLKAQASEARESSAKSAMSSHDLLKRKTEKLREAITDSISLKSDTESSDSQSFGSFQDFQEAAESDQSKFSGITVSLSSGQKTSTTLMPEAEQFDAAKIVPGPNQRVVDEAEWSRINKELQILRKKLMKPTESSPVSRKHTDLFDDDAKMIAEIENLKKTINTLENEKAKEINKTKSLEESIKFSAEDAQKQINGLVEKLSDFERLLGNLREKQIKTKAGDINKLLELTKEKEKLREDLTLLKKERDRLLDLQEKHENTLAKEVMSMPKSIEGMRNLVNMYREALAKAKAEREHSETSLQNNIAFLQERLKAEQSEKEQLESSLASELHDARGEIISLQSLKSVKEELASSQRENAELKCELEKRKTSVEALRSKSNEIIKGLREKHLAEIKAKEDVERNLSETKNRLRSLQSALETSEHVQRDFVRLSQSLQVQLEQVREEREQEKASTETNSVQSLDISSTEHLEHDKHTSEDSMSSPRSTRKDTTPEP